ncbi:hypothetical protein ACFQZO_37165 [Bradyrhizobium sp. GCM10027634]|uniref:hypothetical protein n=1 Tax=unclassified Bradyrhizobium TaxID=2631580 RepID=UPI00263ADED8|nr:hypothetical protein [Bradyrhizobium sp. WYCCWR 12677]MDN5006446.1 hypothetical protein [Bradyrhizobium sp. WYCCWR 12677]
MNSREWNHILHLVFPGIFVAEAAKGKTSTGLSYVTSEHSAYQTNFRGLRAPVDSTSKRNVPNPGSLSGTRPCNFDILQLTSQRIADGGRQSAGSRGDTQYFAGNEIPLPAGSITSPVYVLKSLNLANAMLDSLTVVGGLIALVVFFGSLPLAVGLMIFGVF